MTFNSPSVESFDNTVTQMPLWRRLAIITSLAIGLFYSARIATRPVPLNAASAESAAGAYMTFTRTIEDIRPGDLVLSRDEHGTEIAPRLVKETYRRTSYHLRHLTFRDNAGREQTLQTTDEHPFWSVTDNAFVDAGNLQLGAKVTSPVGDLQTLILTTREECPDGVAVFNFQVDGFHTYFVAATRNDETLLVHNADYQSFEILDGVRRSKAAEIAEKPTILAEVLDETGASQGMRELPLESLLSPKSNIDLADAGLDRWTNTLRQTLAGSLAPPILVQPGLLGTPINQVTVGF
jgi:hypothetical protein